MESIDVILLEKYLDKFNKICTGCIHLKHSLKDKFYKYFFNTITSIDIAVKQEFVW